MLYFLYVTNAHKEKYMDPHCNSFDMFEMGKGKHYKRGLTSQKETQSLFLQFLYLHTQVHCLFCTSQDPCVELHVD